MTTNNMLYGIAQKLLVTTDVALIHNELKRLVAHERDECAHIAEQVSCDDMYDSVTAQTIEGLVRRREGAQNDPLMAPAPGGG